MRQTCRGTWEPDPIGTPQPIGCAAFVTCYHAGAGWSPRSRPLDGGDRRRGRTCSGAAVFAADIGDIRTTDHGAVIHVHGKGSKDRAVPIEFDLLAAIEDYLRRDRAARPAVRPPERPRTATAGPVVASGRPPERGGEAAAVEVSAALQRRAGASPAPAANRSCGRTEATYPRRGNCGASGPTMTRRVLLAGWRSGAVRSRRVRRSEGKPMFDTTTRRRYPPGPVRTAGRGRGTRRSR